MMRWARWAGVAALLGLGACKLSFNEPDEAPATEQASAPRPTVERVPEPAAPVAGAPQPSPRPQLPTTADALSDAPSPFAPTGGEALAPVVGRFAASAEQ